MTEIVEINLDGRTVKLNAETFREFQQSARRSKLSWRTALRILYGLETRISQSSRERYIRFLKRFIKEHEDRVSKSFKARVVSRVISEYTNYIITLYLYVGVTYSEPLVSGVSALKPYFQYYAVTLTTRFSRWSSVLRKLEKSVLLVDNRSFDNFSFRGLVICRWCFSNRCMNCSRRQIRVCSRNQRIEFRRKQVNTVIERKLSEEFDKLKGNLGSEEQWVVYALVGLGIKFKYQGEFFSITINSCQREENERLVRDLVRENIRIRSGR